MTLYVNARFKSHRITGVQRYAHEVSARLSRQLSFCQPAAKLRGWQGHLWEQTALPIQSRSGLLWSPCASGPIYAHNQVVTFHDLFPLDSPEFYNKSYVAWYRFMMRNLASNSLHLIAVSEYTKQRVSSCFQIDPDKITMIHNGIDESLFNATANDATAANHALNLPSPNYLLSVGSLEPRKNFKRLLAAWRQVVSELQKDIWLVVAGSNDPNVYRDACVDDLPERVHLTGYVPDAHLKGLYHGSIAFIYPSLGEGFGLPPLEAMACGTPVLTSQVAALPEVCSSAALYIDPLNVNSIAQAILRLVAEPNLCQKLSILGRSRAREFNWDKTADLTLQTLTNVYNSRSLSPTNERILPAHNTH